MITQTQSALKKRLQADFLLFLQNYIVEVTGYTELKVIVKVEKSKGLKKSKIKTYIIQRIDLEHHLAYQPIEKYVYCLLSDIVNVRHEYLQVLFLLL